MCAYVCVFVHVCVNLCVHIGNKIYTRYIVCIHASKPISTLWNKYWLNIIMYVCVHIGIRTPAGM